MKQKSVFSCNSLTFSMIQQKLAVWSLVPPTKLCPGKKEAKWKPYPVLLPSSKHQKLSNNWILLFTLGFYQVLHFDQFTAVICILVSLVKSYLPVNYTVSRIRSECFLYFVIFWHLFHCLIYCYFCKCFIYPTPKKKKNKQIFGWQILSQLHYFICCILHFFFFLVPVLTCPLLKYALESFIIIWV